MKPPKRNSIQIFDANCTAGNIALRNLKNAYALACWIAWPTSCAPTAVEAIETPRNTSGERWTDRLRGS